MMWTIASPIINKPYAIRLWLENWKRLDFPRKDFKLLWLDMSGNEYISDLLHGFIAKYGSEFAEVQYLVPNKEYRNIADYAPWKSKDFVEKRMSIAESMNIINRNRVGNLLLWEDDIIVPDDAFTRLKEIFDWSDKFYAVTCVQYNRGFGQPNTLLMWDWKKRRVFPENDTCEEMQDYPVVHPYNFERSSGIEFIGSSATGFTLYKSAFLDTHIFEKDGSWGQDIMVGKTINDRGGKLVVCWDVKTAHLATDKNGRFRIVRSPMCNLDVIDEYGVRL